MDAGCKSRLLVEMEDLFLLRGSERLEDTSRSACERDAGQGVRRTAGYTENWTDSPRLSIGKRTGEGLAEQCERFCCFARRHPFPLHGSAQECFPLDDTLLALTIF